MSSLLHFSGLTADLIVVGITLLIFFLISLYFGKAKLISLILAYYPAVLLYNSFPYLQSILFAKGESLLILNKLVVFLIILILLSIAIGRFIFSESGYGGSHVVRHIGFSVAATVLFFVFIHSIITINFIYKFSPSIEVLFGTADKIFWWLLFPLILIFFL